MAGSDFTPKSSVDLNFWQKHLLTKMFSGFDLVIWPKKAGTTKLGTLFTPCNRKSAVALLDAGFLKKVGKSKDGKGVIYELKEGVEEPQKTKKRRSRSSSKDKAAASPKPKKVVEVEEVAPEAKEDDVKEEVTIDAEEVELDLPEEDKD